MTIPVEAVARFVVCVCDTGSGCFRDRGSNAHPQKPVTQNVTHADAAEAGQGRGSHRILFTIFLLYLRNLLKRNETIYTQKLKVTERQDMFYGKRV